MATRKNTLSLAHAQVEKSVTIQIEPGILNALLDAGEDIIGPEELDDVLCTVSIPQRMVQDLTNRLAVVIAEGEGPAITSAVAMLCSLLRQGATTAKRAENAVIETANWASENAEAGACA